jgi:hypothetical protein
MAVRTIASTSDRDQWPDWVRGGTAEIRAFLANAEARFADLAWRNVVLSLVPDADAWSAVRRDPQRADALAAGVLSDEGLRLSARLHVEEIADTVGLVLDEESLRIAADRLAETFPLPMRVFNAFLYRVISRGLDASAPEVANSIWDLQLSMSVPASSRVSQTPVWLVTTDTLIHDAAEAAGAGHLVHDLAAYKQLQADGDALRTALSKF